MNEHEQTKANRRDVAEVTPEMVAAGFRVLAASGLEGVIEGVDSLLVEEIYLAMLAAAPRPS